MEGSVPETNSPSGRARLRSRRVQLAAGLLVVTIAVLVAGLAAVLTRSAGALAAVYATENINTAQVSLGYSADSPDSTWTNLGSLSLTPGASYVVFAKAQLTNVSAGVAASGECVLSAPNEPFDLQDASLVGVKGSSTASVNLMGLTQLQDYAGTPRPGSVQLLCRVTSPGAVGMVTASHARVLALPVDSVINNKGTFRCGNLAVPPC